MSYCINPKCQDRDNQDDKESCSTCGTPLLIQKQYRLLKPLRELSPQSNTEVFVVDAGGEQKVMKVLQNPSLLPWFEREAQTLKRLQHPGIIPRVKPDGYFTFELDKGKKLHCLVMEKLEGKNLEQWLKDNGAIKQNRAVDWLKQLLNILDILHENKLFHRDIKLANILLQHNDKLALIDFGTVREVSDTYLSKVGVYAGITSIVSPGYSPPEQMNGNAVPQSDFYALGCCFIHLLTGVHPLDFSEDEQTGKLIWYDDDNRKSDDDDKTWLPKLIYDLDVSILSKQKSVHLLTGIHPFSEDKQTSKPTISYGSELEVDTWLAKLIDKLIEPVRFKRPLQAKEILYYLETRYRFLHQQKRLLLITTLLQLLNPIILVSALITFWFYLLDQPKSTDDNQKSDSTKQVIIYHSKA